MPNSISIIGLGRGNLTHPDFQEKVKESIVVFTSVSVYGLITHFGEGLISLAKEIALV